MVFLIVLLFVFGINLKGSSVQLSEIIISKRLSPAKRAYYIDIIDYHSPIVFPDVVNGRFFAVNGMMGKNRPAAVRFCMQPRAHEQVIYKIPRLFI